jgi:type VI secretion system ImpB/VipA family protein
MEYSVNFGSLSSKKRAVAPNAKFRLALLGDFSGRANAGKNETGAALAKRKPIKVDVDNLDDILERMKLELSLSLDGDEAVVSVPVGSMDDFHPDQIVENVELFSELRGLRRNLGNKSTFDRAAKTVLSWSGEDALPPLPRKAAGSSIATDRKLSDFARLTGRPSAAEAAEASVEDLMRRIVGPLVEPARDARADQLIGRVDEALSTAMRRILHHPDFQSAEALWRGVEFLVRRIETGAKMEILLYDVSAQELAADIAGADDLSECGLYGMLVEQPALDAGQGAISVVIGLYNFELMPPHAELLGRIAQVAAAAGAPFIAGIGPDPLKLPVHEQHPLIKESWQALRELQAAAYLGLATPRFLLRTPYGKKTDPIDAFALRSLPVRADYPACCGVIRG